MLIIYLLFIICWNNKSSSTKQNSPRTTMVNYIKKAKFASVKGKWILGNREIEEKNHNYKREHWEDIFHSLVFFVYKLVNMNMFKCWLSRITKEADI